MTCDILISPMVISATPQLSPAPNPAITILFPFSNFPSNSDTIVNGTDVELVFPYFWIQYGTFVLSNRKYFTKKSVMNLFAWWNTK